MKAVKRLKRIQGLLVMAKGIIDFVDDPEKVIENIEKFNDAKEFLAKNPITEPIGEIIGKIPQIMVPVIMKTEPTFKRMLPDAKRFKDKLEDFVHAIKGMFALIKQAEKGKVTDKPRRYINACRLLECLSYSISANLNSNEFGDKHMPLLRILKAILVLEKIAKTVDFIRKLLEKKIPFVGKSVGDYLESGGSNPIVTAAKVAIQAAAKPVEWKVKKATKIAIATSDCVFPKVEP